MLVRCTFLLVLTGLFTTGFSDVLIDLPDGTILGRESETFTGKPFYVFQKIPYASPPVGNLRFKAPVPPDRWDGILNTTNLDVVCYQPTQKDASEDCLYLNVYTPALPSNNVNVSIPVLVFIYGGGFFMGSVMQDEYGPEFLIDYDIIVVTFNYRLGPFGFLSTGDAVIPGNSGLKDQHLAIKWVHENIQLFGGDNQKITISGESAGAVSTSFHLLNKQSEGLFNGAIIESGTAMNSWAINREARQLAFAIGATLNDTFSNTDDSQLLLDYLLTVSAEDLSRVTSMQNEWAPVIEVEHDSAFITEKMYGLFKSGNFIRVPILMGFNSEEAIGDTPDLDELRAKLALYDDDVSLLVDTDMRISDIETKRQYGEAIKKKYCGDGNFADNLGAGVRYETDNHQTRADIKNAELQSKFTNVYFYQFSHDGLMGNVNVSVEGAEHVAHMEELRYLWRSTNRGYDNSDLSRFPSEDVTTQRILLTLWTNFVKTGNPTPEESVILQNVTWPTISSGEVDDLFYLDIDVNLEVKNHPKGETYPFWTELYDSLGFDDFDTY